MNINTDINILGGLPDMNLIKLFMFSDIQTMNAQSGHRSYTAIRTDKAVKRFEKSIHQTLLTFKDTNLRIIYENFIEAEGINPDFLLLLFWNASSNNDLLNYLNQHVYFPALYSGRTSIKADEVVACLQELKLTDKQLSKWSDSTLETTASKYLTLLKKFGLLEGSLKKSISHIYLSDKLFVLFLYWIVAVEVKSNLLDSPWINYAFTEKTFFIERVKNKKLSSYFSISYSGDKLKVEPTIPYQEIYHVLTQH